MKRHILLSIFCLNSIVSYSSTNQVDTPITTASFIYQITTEKIDSFHIENADLTTCLLKLSQQVGNKFILLDGFDKKKKVSIQLDDVTLDSIVKVVALAYHVDYRIHPKGIVFHPLDQAQCDMLTMKSYHVPLSHIINPEVLNSADAKTDGVKYGSTDHHAIVYREDNETLFIKTCIPQQEFIKSWLEATVPNLEEK